MAIDTKNPKYTEMLYEWIQLRDLFKGERVVKEKGTEYLPATSAMNWDGMDHGQAGRKDYEAYKKRARVPNYIKQAVKKLVGLIHQKDPTIELPKIMEPMLDCATVDGESLLALLRRINTEQILTGRIGIMADLPSAPTVESILPYLATYDAERMINWDSDAGEEVQKLRLVVLDETRMAMDPIELTWETRISYRVLTLMDPNGLDTPNGSEPTYMTGLFESTKGEASSFDTSKLVAPSIRGTQLQKIPFVFINSQDTLPDPDDAPLTDLGNLCLTIYRAEADYRQTLFMQSQDTLVVIAAGQEVDEFGNPKETRVGAGSRIDVNVGGDAKYIGISSSGLSEQRLSLENDRKEARELSGEMIAAQVGTESGVALNTRITAKTATLNEIAMSGAAGLQYILRICAEWIGADPEEVVVTPNLEFTDFAIDGMQFVQLMTARAQGAPLSLESIHALMVERGLTKMAFEDEQSVILQENAGGAGLDGTGDGTTPPADPPVDPIVPENKKDTKVEDNNGNV